MIKYTFKLIYRNFWSRRIYTSVILLSLVTAFVCSNILISFLVYETDTDTFYANGNRIFQLFSADPFGDGDRIAYLPNFMNDYLINNYAEIEEVCQLSKLDGIVIQSENTSFHDFTILSVDRSFFSIFDFPLLQGSKNESLAPDDIVLSKEKVSVLFNKRDVIGETITLITPDTTRLLTVSAVVDKPKGNSHITFDALVHHSVFKDSWNGGASYVLMADTGLSQSLQEKVNSDDNRPGLLGPGKIDYFFEPIAKSYFSSENKMSYMKTRNPTFLKVGYSICGLILFIAGFNFINLFLLFWNDRKKEMGIKKVLGITPKGLLVFSITEAGFYIFISFFLSLIITLLIIPIFNSVFEANISPKHLLNVKVASYIGLIVFLSGSSIVFFSVLKQLKIKPISLMKNEFSKVTFNGLLFTIQFVISITLTICSISIIQQMNYVEGASLGFNRKIIQLDTPNEKYSQKLPVLKHKIGQLPYVNSVTVSGGNPISGNGMVRYDLEDGKFYTPFLFGGDDDFLETLGLNLLEGDLPSEILKGKLVNQKLVNQFSMKKPIGARVPGTEDIIIGVVEDFTCGSFKEEIPPVIISYYKDGQSLLIDYKGKDLLTLLPQVQEEWKKLFPDYYFTYIILEEELMKKYKEDTFFYNIIIVFSIISMILSCFGLFALSWAVVQSRAKEMGIRKVLGATTTDIINLLTLAFSKRILFAFIVAAPVGYYLMHLWLTRFANKIELNIWIFVISGSIVTIIAAGTLSVQIIKATMKNPVDEIKNE